MTTRTIRTDDSQHIRAVKQTRQGWENAFRSMAEEGDDELLDKDSFIQTQWDEDEWQW